MGEKKESNPYESLASPVAAPFSRIKFLFAAVAYTIYITRFSLIESPDKIQKSIKF